MVAGSNPAGRASHQPVRGWFASSDKLGLAWLGRRGQFDLGVPVEIVRHELLLGLQGLVPGDLLAGIGRHATHQSHETGVRHAPAVVDRMTGADGSEELVVLSLMHAILGSAVAPRIRPGDDRNWPAPDGAYALGTDDVIGILLVTAILTTQT